MPRKPVPRNRETELPHWICNECYFYDPIAVEHGACYALPPTILYDADGDLTCPRTIVLAEDKGCIHWRARHVA